MTTPNIQALIASIERIRVELGEVSQGLAALAGTAAPCAMTAATHGTDAARLARVEAWMRENDTTEAPSLRRVKQVARCGDGPARRVLDELLTRYGDPLTAGPHA